MKENMNYTLPLIGRIQHGEQIIKNGKTSVKEYGHFIAKIQEQNMKPYLDKFNELLKGSKSIDIQFLDDAPLSIKRIRYNQSGATCYCMNNENMGKQKKNNKWEPIECNSNCSYLQKDKNGKSACNRIAWLKFFIPSITNDRLWLMRITGQQSINNLNGYIQLQKLQGNSLNNLYTLFLKQETQTNSLGKTFNNYVIDIMKKEDFLSEKKNFETSKNPIEISTTNTKNVNNDVVNQEQNILDEQLSATTVQTKNEILTETISEEKIEPTEKTKKSQKNKSKKNENIVSPSNSEDNNTTIIYNDYALLKTFYETLINKNGESKEYLVGEFCNTSTDEIDNIVIKPEYAEELSNCDLGTYVKLYVQDRGNRKFAMDLQFMNKCKKNIAA